jgi:hypothetical protein
MDPAPPSDAQLPVQQSIASQLSPIPAQPRHAPLVASQAYPPQSHGLQDALAPGEEVPEAQDEHPPEPSGSVPALQATGGQAPVMGSQEAPPQLHHSHDRCPAASWYCPSGQAVQLAACNPE